MLAEAAKGLREVSATPDSDWEPTHPPRGAISSGLATILTARFNAALDELGVRSGDDVDWALYDALAALLCDQVEGAFESHSFDYVVHQTAEDAMADRPRPPEPRRLHYTLWPGPPERTLVCVGGICNTARRFDFMASTLAGAWRVACLDWAGRGLSGWLPSQSDYRFDSHADQLEAFIEHLDCGPVNVLGSSLGGMAALQLSQRRPELIARLILNDVGTFLPSARRQRRAKAVNRFYVLRTPSALFRGAGANEKNVGRLSDAVLFYTSLHMTRWSEADGGRVYRHDMRAMAAYAAEARHDVDLRAAWRTLEVPCLVIHGLQSTALSEATLEEMARDRLYSLIRVPDAGHTPVLSTGDQLVLIRAWLEEPWLFVEGGADTALPPMPQRRLFPPPVS